MDNVQENIDSARRAGAGWLDEHERKLVHLVQEEYKKLSPIPCTKCGYCMPCPEGVNISRNFSLCNDHHMLKDPMARVRYHRILGESERASNCTRCGECLEKCPQQIPIPDELEYVSGLFGG